MTPSARTDLLDDEFLDQAWDRAHRRARMEVARPYGAGGVEALQRLTALAQEHGQRAVTRVIEVAVLAAMVIGAILATLVVYVLGEFLGEIAGFSYGGAIAVAVAWGAALLGSGAGQRFTKRRI